jgi:hypothetical protein
VARTAILREGELTVGVQDPKQRHDDDLLEMWYHIGERLVDGRSRLDARLDRLETNVDVLKTDVAVLKADVAVLKTDVAGTKDQLGRLERSTESRFNRVDAQLERLITLVQRAETKRP